MIFRTTKKKKDFLGRPKNELYSCGLVVKVKHFVESEAGNRFVVYIYIKNNNI